MYVDIFFTVIENNQAIKEENIQWNKINVTKHFAHCLANSIDVNRVKDKNKERRAKDNYYTCTPDQLDKIKYCTKSFQLIRIEQQISRAIEKYNLLSTIWCRVLAWTLSLFGFDKRKKQIENAKMEAKILKDHRNKLERQEQIKFESTKSLLVSRLNKLLKKSNQVVIVFKIY